MDAKCLEIERVMEGIRNLVENRCPLSLGLVFGWENPYSFIIIFFSNSSFLFVFKKYPIAHLHSANSPGRLKNSSEEVGQIGKGAWVDSP